MARMRMVKPEIVSSEQFVSCSRDARLLFITLWTQCDDRGVHQDSARRLKMELFPADDDATTSVISGWLEELVKIGLVGRFASGSDQYLYVTGWQRHQRVTKPYYRFPKPPNWVGNHAPVHDQLATSDVPVHDQYGADGSGVLADGSGVLAEHEYEYEPDNGKGKSAPAGSFASVTVGILRDTAQLVAWRTANVKSEPCTDDLMFVVAAAEKALERGRNKPSLFVDIMKNSRRDFVTAANMDRAAARLGEFRNRGAPAASQHGSALAKNLKPTD